MKNIELICRSLLQLLLATCAAFICLKLCSGCTLVRQTVNRENVAEAIKKAYAEGGRTAVSNKIEKLVVSGDLSAKQAAKLHELAEKLYDHVLEKLEGQIEEEAKAETETTAK